MGKDSPWPNGGFNSASNLWPPNIRQRTTNSIVFPTYANPFGCSFPGNASVQLPGFAAHKLLQRNSASIPPLNPSGFLVFDQSGDQTNLVFSSAGNPFPYLTRGNPGADLLRSEGTNVSDGRGGEELHENTEEIDALLYSDSEDECKEEEASTGHSPLETMTVGSTEAASSSAVPAKRRRVDAGLDTSLTDTASSAGGHHWGSHRREEDDEAELSCVKGGEQGGAEPGKEQDSPAAPSRGCKRQRREKIQETVGVLRRIIPGGSGKDATAVLDEAIRYLRSLKLKAKALGSATML